MIEWGFPGIFCLDQLIRADSTQSMTGNTTDGLMVHGIMKLYVILLIINVATVSRCISLDLGFTWRTKPKYPLGITRL